jgi:F0F1-type ATP synthase epsilon subunit
MLPVKTFELEILRPTGSKKIEILWVEVEAENGSFIIGPDHSNLVSLLKQKERLVYKTVQNLEVEIAIESGLLAVVKGRALVLLNA